MKHLATLVLTFAIPLFAYGQVTISGQLEITFVDPNAHINAQTTTPQKIASTDPYVGLVWEIKGFETNLAPSIVVGVRRTEGNKSGDVKGIDLNIRFSTNNGVEIESTRFMLLTGKPKELAQLGAGYSHVHKSMIAIGSYQLSHLRFTTDYLISSKQFEFYTEVNALKKPKSAN